MAVEPVTATHTSGVVLPLVHTYIDTEFVTQHGGHRVLVTVDKRDVELPPIEDIAFFAGLSVLAGIGLIEPPVAAVIGIGHVLLHLTRRPGLAALGEILEEA